MIPVSIQIQQFIASEKTDEMIGSPYKYKHSIFFADGHAVSAFGETEHRAKSHALSKAIEFALKKGWVSNEPKLFLFSTALEFLLQGRKITRKGWNGADQWLSISCPESKEVAAENFWSPHNAEFARNNGGTATVAPCITLKNAQGRIIMGWIPSAGDLFANDWMIAK